MTAMAAAVAASQAGAESITPAAQTERADYPFAEEMAIIQDTRDAALALCEEDKQARLAQLRAVIDRGTVTDRNALIAIMEDMGAPAGGVNDNTDRELVSGAISMAGTNAAICDREAYQASSESLAALQQVLEDNMAALRAQTLQFSELNEILLALESFASGDADVLSEISELRAEAVRLQALAASLNQQANSASASADENEAAAAEYARRIEAVWARIAAGTEA